MLEIILLVWLCKSIGAMLRAKDRQPLVFQIFVVLLWFGGEIFGAVVAGVIHVVQHGPDAPFEPGIETYLFALVGAACGVGLLFLIAHLLPPANRTPFMADPGLEPNADTPNSLSGIDPNNPYAPPTTRN